MKYVNQFYYLLDNHSKKTLPFLICIFIFSSALDVAGIGLIGIFLSLLTHSTLLLQHYYYFHYLFIPKTQNARIMYFGLFIIIIFSAKTFINLFIQKKVVYFCQYFSIQLKERLMSAYQYAPYHYHLRKNSSVMMARIQDNINNFSLNTIMPILNLISSTLISIAISFFLLILHPYITLALLILFIFIALICHYLTKIKFISLATIHSQVSGEIIKSIFQGLHGISEIRIFGKESYFLNNFKKNSKMYVDTISTLAILQLTPRYLIEGMMVIFIVSLTFGGLYFNIDTKNIVVIAGLFAAAGTRLLPIVNQLIASVQQIRGSYYHGKLIYDDLIELTPLVLNSQLTLKSIKKISFKNIQLKNVIYYYPETNYPALYKINMCITKGESIGIIGPSGAGKSTLIHIILGLLQPQQGNLLIDFQPIIKIREWLNNFAYIPQTIFLLDDTLKNNIAFGIDNNEIDNQLIQQVINMSKLSEVVERLPKGMDTLIGENGIRLSGGQRQRVALARALYHERDILIMDEATSALDQETEAEVINMIKQLKGDKTIIVIAHRLSTIQHCDKIFRLKGGHIVASGCYEEVIC